MAFDQDEDAKANVPDDERIIFVPHNFVTCNGFCGCIK